jgi:hypothetical protein
MILLSRPPLARTLPSNEKSTVKTSSLPFSQMSGNTYIIVAYASPPLNLRLSPGERGESWGGVGKTVTYNGLALRNGTDQKRYLWPFSVVRHVPNSTSQILRLMSQDADTMVLPWGAKTHAETALLSFFEMSGNTFVRSSTPLPP